ncbi:MAG: hypothetical protein ACKO34_04480 [Vampirovibrionales bacterium]
MLTLNTRELNLLFLFLYLCLWYWASVKFIIPMGNEWIEHNKTLNVFNGNQSDLKEKAQYLENLIRLFKEDSETQARQLTNHSLKPINEMAFQRFYLNTLSKHHLQLLALVPKEERTSSLANSYNDKEDNTTEPLPLLSKQQLPIYERDYEMSIQGSFTNLQQFLATLSKSSMSLGLSKIKLFCANNGGKVTIGNLVDTGCNTLQLDSTLTLYQLNSNPFL